ncbi:hypothetical protein MRX96_041016 [Rhipicephalus microplus]
MLRGVRSRIHVVTTGWGGVWSSRAFVDQRAKVEPEHLLQQQDFLTCGVCQKEFALSDIVRFIQHKVHSCNKENCLLFDGSPGEDDFDADRPDLPVGSAAASANNSNAVGVTGSNTPSSRRCPGSQVSALSSLKRSHHHGTSGGSSVTASSTSSHHHHHHRLSHNNVSSVTNNSNSNHSLDLADRLKARVSLEPHLHKYGSSTTTGGGAFGAAASRTGSGGGLLVNDSNGGGGGVASPTSPRRGPCGRVRCRARSWSSVGQVAPRRPRCRPLEGLPLR